MSITILAIESSCDETAAAIMQDGHLRSQVVANQSVHEQFGGVVPELASRAHQKNIIPVVSQSLSLAAIDKKNLSAVAFTRGPGLLGSLLVGGSFAKGFALSLGIPLIEVQHLQAHILAHFIEDPKPPFPFLCLLVSGGHTQLVKVNDYFDMEIIGQTLDDAVGEAFDKTAKLLGLPYPGGPLIDKLAQNGNPHAYEFPIVEMPDFNYSFSGIKTNIMYFLQKKKLKEKDFVEKNIADICASIQYTLVQILLKPLLKSIKQSNIQHIAIGGGVAANSGLRNTLLELGEKNHWTIYIPKFEYCTDNAAMIAMTGYLKYLQNDFSNQKVSPLARM